MAIATLVPRVDYNQFTDRYVRHQKLSDDFMPEYNGIGYQDVLVGDLLTQYAPVGIWRPVQFLRKILLLILLANSLLGLSI